MEPLQVFREYVQVKAHFNRKDFVYGKQHVKVLQSALNRRTDKYFFENFLARKHKSEIVPFFVANFVERKNLWIGDLYMNIESEETYIEWRKKMDAIKRFIYEELLTINEFIVSRGITFNALFEFNDGKKPIIFRFLEQQIISLETFIVFDKVLGIMDVFGKTLKNDPVFKAWELKIMKYGLLFDIRTEEYQKMMHTLFVGQKRR